MIVFNIPESTYIKLTTDKHVCAKSAFARHLNP